MSRKSDTIDFRRPEYTPTQATDSLPPVSTDLPNVIEPPPAPRAEGWLRGMGTVWLTLDRALHRFIPPPHNPLGQLGAMANTCLIVAVITGVLLLFWYTPSVHQAHVSLERIRESSWLGQLMRSLHRYSADACVALMVLHALRMTLQGRFTGPRWLAWVTGVALFALMGFIGWTGYWLVWDVRAQHAALGTVRFIDWLPLFTEPLSRSFLTDQSVPSLLFFLIFFVHMLAPLAVGVGIWMHLMRINRSRFLTGRILTVWVLGSLLAISVLWPATSAEPAQMTVKARRFTMDWWYLWPVLMTDRLSGGVLWCFFLGTGLVALTMPWWMVKQRLTSSWVARVNLRRCMGCTLCALDCPFNAINMVPREDGKPFPVQAQVNPTLCVACGVCTGSCESQAIDLPARESRELEARLTTWISRSIARGERPLVGFTCAESAGAALPEAGDAEWPELAGIRIERVPCVGWISAVLLERILARGAEGVLVVGCGEVEPVAREGMKWFAQRMTGQREPRFDPRKADPSRVRFVALDRARPRELLDAIREFRAGRTLPASAARFPRVRQCLAGLTTAAVLGVLTYGLSDLPYRTPHSPEPELVVSFNHSGEILETRKLTEEELAKRLPHMRAQVNVNRERAPVRLRILVDGRVVSDQAHEPKGLSRDGPSSAVVRLPIEPGRHDVRVELADTADPDRWTREWNETVDFAEGRVRVVLFDGKFGFSLH